MSTTSLESPPIKQIYQWNWQGKTIAVAYETVGNGKPMLLLPSFSTVSSRTEMSGLAAYLTPQFEVTSLDFPGFGDSDRSSLDYSPALYRQFLADFVRDHYSTPIAIVAAGHAAGYAIEQAATIQGSVCKLILVAPTWRGPLPTMARGVVAKSIFISDRASHEFGLQNWDRLGDYGAGVII